MTSKSSAIICQFKGLFICGKTLLLPDPGLRGEIPPSNRILFIFISRLYDERNTTGIVKSHLTRCGISPGWGEIFHINRTPPVKWGELELFVVSHWSVYSDFTEERLYSTSTLSPGADRCGEESYINSV